MGEGTLFVEGGYHSHLKISSCPFGSGKGLNATHHPGGWASDQRPASRPRRARGEAVERMERFGLYTHVVQAMNIYRTANPCTHTFTSTNHLHTNTGEITPTKKPLKAQINLHTHLRTSTHTEPRARIYLSRQTYHPCIYTVTYARSHAPTNAQVRDKLGSIRKKSHPPRGI